jgi:hypothetical protein
MVRFNIITKFTYCLPSGQDKYEVPSGQDRFEGRAVVNMTMSFRVL